MYSIIVERLCPVIEHAKMRIRLIENIDLVYLFIQLNNNDGNEPNNNIKRKIFEATPIAAQ